MAVKAEKDMFLDGLKKNRWEKHGGAASNNKIL